MIIDPSVIRQVSREKDIDPEKMFAALEEALSSAARKFYHDKAVVTAIDRKTGEMAGGHRHLPRFAVDRRHDGLVVVELARGRGHRLFQRGEHLLRIDVLLARHLSDDRRIDDHRKAPLLNSPFPATETRALPPEYRRNGHYRFCGFPHQRPRADRPRRGRGFPRSYGPRSVALGRAPPRGRAAR